MPIYGLDTPPAPPVTVTATVGPYTLTATSDVTAGRVLLTAEGGTEGDQLLLLRRDGGGVQVVRDTSSGAVVWPATGAVQVADYEARQGSATDYLLTDEDGAQLVGVRITIPAWGTWLKSPGRPFRNARCYLESEVGVTRPARRVLVPVAGASRHVALSDTRHGPLGDVRLLTLTTEQATAVRRVLDDGAVLLLDTAPEWNLPYRYVSVGDVTEERPHGGQLGLDREARWFALSDVADQPAPVGASQVNPNASYDQLPGLFGSYAALAASVPTYELLGTV